jgi:hypothetical protein
MPGRTRKTPARETAIALAALIGCAGVCCQASAQQWPGWQHSSHQPDPAKRLPDAESLPSAGTSQEGRAAVPLPGAMSFPAIPKDRKPELRGGNKVSSGTAAGSHFYVCDEAGRCDTLDTPAAENDGSSDG